MVDINVIIAGAAGQGIQTVGTILAKTVLRAGYSVFSWQEYESRIRGGSNSYRIRISENISNAPLRRADILVPLDKKSKAKYLPLLKKDGILVDEEETGEKIINVPFTKMSKEKFGNKLFANTVALGSLVSVLGIEFLFLKEVLTEEFSGKTEEVIKGNLSAANIGYKKAQLLRGAICNWELPGKNEKYYLISGNEAAALGAAAAGCRFMAAYPMTPATGIITFISKHMEELQIFTEQAEDEIAAINMAIGASYAGARAMTATSGGGFALMVEGISLAGMTETPVVIVLGQRPGPATGLPTRTEQGDLLFAVNAGHGEFPKLVFAPSDPKDAFHKMIRSFDLAYKYQIPAIVMSDQFLSTSSFTIENIDLGKIANKSYIANPENINSYNRYQLTETGISPRLYPGQSNHLVCCDSDEHDESGHITEDLELRNRMVEKRLKKNELLKKEIRPPEMYHISEAEKILISWGSSRNAVLEAANRIRGEGEKVGVIHFTELWPMPDFTFPLGKHYYTVESNATGQFRRLLLSEYDLKIEGTIGRYDGLPMDSEYVIGRFAHV